MQAGNSQQLTEILSKISAIFIDVVVLQSSLISDFSFTSVGVFSIIKILL